MRDLKIRGLVGSIISLAAGVVSFVFLALPMLVEIPGHTLYSVFYSIFRLGEVSNTLGVDGNLYVASTALMIVFMIVSLAIVVLSILSIVAVCTKKYDLDMAIGLRCLTLINAVIATIATTLLLLYFSQNNLVDTTFGVGPIVELAVALISVGGAFVLPSNIAFYSKMRLEEKIAQEQIIPKKPN